MSNFEKYFLETFIYLLLFNCILGITKDATIRALLYTVLKQKILGLQNMVSILV